MNYMLLSHLSEESAENLSKAMNNLKKVDNYTYTPIFGGSQRPPEVKVEPVAEEKKSWFENLGEKIGVITEKADATAETAGKVSTTGKNLLSTIKGFIAPSDPNDSLVGVTDNKEKESDTILGMPKLVFWTIIAVIVIVVIILVVRKK